MDKVMKLIRYGARNAILEERETLVMEDFAVAFNEYHRYLSKGGRSNPFIEEDFSL